MLHANSMVSPCDFCPFVRSSKTNEKDAETERWRQKRGGAAEPQGDRFGHEVARRFGPVATETSRRRVIGVPPVGADIGENDVTCVRRPDEM